MFRGRMAREEEGMAKALQLMGDSIFIEVDDDVRFEETTTSNAGGEVAGPREIIERLTSIGDAIGRVCSTLNTQALKSLGDAKPSELEIQFALKLAGEAGVPMVAKGSAEGALQITAKWSLKDEHKQRATNV
jgi:hypothetical protein